MFVQIITYRIKAYVCLRSVKAVQVHLLGKQRGESYDKKRYERGIYQREYNINKFPMSSIALVDNEYSNDNAKKELGKIMDASAFDFPKPTSLIKRLISIIDKENITVLDFFAGSGTTGHAVLDFNAELIDGKCEFILVNNNENNICRNITYNRIKTVIEREKYNASLKYFTIDYVDISDRQYYEYADNFLLHIKELVELENGIDFNTDKRIKIILTDEELRTYIDSVFKDNPCRTIYLGHNVLLPIEDEKKLIARGVEIRRIPDYYYGELK